MTEPSEIGALILQVAAQGERIGLVDEHEREHAAELFRRITELADTATGLTGALDGQEVVVRELGVTSAELRQSVAALVVRMDEVNPAEEDNGQPVYRPHPAPRFWMLDGAERDAAIATLRMWVRDIYLGQLGYFSKRLGPCWEQHPLALAVLDVTSELWAVLWLQPRRNARQLAEQGEFLVRFLPALSEVLVKETTSCSHARDRGPMVAGVRP